MFEERIAAMNQRTEEAMAANAVQFDTGVPDPQPESPRHGRRQSPKEEEAPCPCKWVSSYLQPPFGMSAANLIRSSVNDFALRR